MGPTSEHNLPMHFPPSTINELSTLHRAYCQPLEPHPECLVQLHTHTPLGRRGGEVEGRKDSFVLTSILALLEAIFFNLTQSALRHAYQQYTLMMSLAPLA